MYCPDCEALDRYFFANTWFWLFLPTDESTKKITTMLESTGFEFSPQDANCIATLVKASRLKEFLLSLNGELQPPELAHTKITTSEADTLSIADTARMISAETLINRFNGAWLVESLEKEWFETHFQTIFSLDDARKPTAFAHEGLFRLWDESGNQVPPDHVFRVAEYSDLLFSLDLVARRSAVAHYAKAKLDGKLFINFNPSSIYDPAYCLRATASAIAALGISASDVVFEITETHSVRNESVMKGILSFYRSAGFGVALDDIGSGYSGLNMLHKFRPDYVKIDMELVRDLHADTYKQTIVEHLVEIAHTNGAKVIAEGIENEQERDALLRLGADYYQGFYFGRPKARPSVLSEREQMQIDIQLRGIG